jgi:hypothetical protein
LPGISWMAAQLAASQEGLSSVSISGVRLWVSWYSGHYWSIVPAPVDRWWWLWRNWWNEDWQGKPNHSEKTCPSATLSTTNPTWLDPGFNLGRRGRKPATNRLRFGAPICYRDAFTFFIPNFNVDILAIIYCDNETDDDDDMAMKRASPSFLYCVYICIRRM